MVRPPPKKNHKIVPLIQFLDGDDDGLITAEDIKKVVRHLCGKSSFSPEELGLIVDNVLKEAEGRESHAIGPQEFRNIMTRSPDFGLNFTIRI